MSIIGGYRYSSGVSGATATEGIVNVATFKISGLINTAGFACCQYVWNATNSQWEPMTQP